jgi:Zn-dependent protease with chaperone function
MAVGVLSPAFAGNILKDLFKVYTTYQQVNMMLWLAGDAKAEKRFGEEVKWITLLTNKREKNAETNRWVNSIFDRIKPHFRDRGFNYTITVLKGNDVNAFAIPGGHIFVYQGMLNFVGSDDELAAVLAHELSHSERRHSLKQLRKSTAFNLLMQKAVKNVRDRETWGQVLGALTMLKFSRDDENEADELGQVKMTAAGYNPYGQVVLWEKFVQKFGKGDTGLGKYLSTHPPSTERVAHARNNLAKLGFVPSAAAPGPVTGGPKAAIAVATAAMTGSGTVGVPPVVPPAASGNGSASGSPAGPVLSSIPELVLSYNVLSDEEENLLPNGSFETDLNRVGFPDAWDVKSGKAFPSREHRVGGRVSLKLQPASRVTPARVVSELIPLHKNQKLLFHGRVKSSGSGQRISVGAEVLDQKKRIRGYIWPVLAGASLPQAWSPFSGAFERGNGPQQIPPDGAFLRLILQNGPVSEGPIWFDDLVLQRSTWQRPVNLLTAGSFEIQGAGGAPEGVFGTMPALKQDLDHPKTGYASLRMDHYSSGQTEMNFAQIPLTELKDRRVIHCSFHHKGSAEIKGMLKAVLVFANGKPAPKTILEKEFRAKPGLWQANSWRAEFHLTPEEKKAALAVQVVVTAPVPANASLWVDGFVLRP